MKIVYVVHAIRGKVLVDEVLLPYKALDEPLSIEDLENVFEAHNLQSKRLSMTGWPDFLGSKDYVVDVDCMDVWSCEPVGWKRIMHGVC